MSKMVLVCYPPASAEMGRKRVRVRVIKRVRVRVRVIKRVRVRVIKRVRVRVNTHFGTGGGVTDKYRKQLFPCPQI